MTSTGDDRTIAAVNGDNGMTASVIAVIAAIAIAAAPPPARAEGLNLFPPSPKSLSAETMPFTQTLHTGEEDGEFYTRGRFGVDFHVLGYDFGNERDVRFGITAAAHINMIPEGQRFPVDNFYATLALHFSGMYGEKVSWRFYPIYHVSAHLADGYKSDILKEEVRPISSEMIRGEVYYKPFGDILELGAGGGWYYHVCAQKGLRYKGDGSILVTPHTSLLGGIIKPFVLIRGENVFQSGHNPGGEVSGGVFALKNNRGIGLSVRYFNHLHRSYYYDRYEKGWGGEYTFIF